MGQEQDVRLRAALARYLRAVEFLALAAIDEPSRKHLLPLREWFIETLDTASGQMVLQETVESLTSVSRSESRMEQDLPDTVGLMILELEGMSKAIESQRDALAWSESPDSRFANSGMTRGQKASRTRGRNAMRKDLLNASGTTMGSILDALGDLHPAIRGVLKAVQEVIDMAKG